MLAPQLAADIEVERQRILYLALEERLLDGDAGKLGGKGRMAAMVAPISIEDAQLGLERIAPLLAEVTHDLAQVVGAHGQTIVLTAGPQLVVGQLAKTLQHLDGLHFGLLHVAQHGEVFLARLDGIDAIMLDPGQVAVADVAVEDEQARRTDAHLGGGVDQPHAIDSRSSPLVELTGQELDGDEPMTAQIARVAHGVGNDLAEDGIPALFEQLLAEAEEIVDIQQPKRPQGKPQIGIQLAPQALGLDLETGKFFDENTIITHILIYSYFTNSSLHRPAYPAASDPTNVM